MTLAEYHDALSRHDWHYEQSDDPGVYRAGFRKHVELELIATSSPEHKHLFESWVKHKKRGAERPVYFGQHEAAE